MAEEKKISLKTPAGRKLILGKHIDVALQLATKNGYGCEFVYNNSPIKSPGRSILIMRVDDKNIITSVK